MRRMGRGRFCSARRRWGIAAEAESAAASRAGDRRSASGVLERRAQDFVSQITTGPSDESLAALDAADVPDGGRPDAKQGELVLTRCRKSRDPWAHRSGRSSARPI